MLGSGRAAFFRVVDACFAFFAVPMWAWYHAVSPPDTLTGDFTSTIVRTRSATDRQTARAKLDSIGRPAGGSQPGSVPERAGTCRGRKAPGTGLRRWAP